MREILFRGKKIGTGEWYLGWLGHFDDNSYFINGKDEYDNYVGVQVELETVGQFTGLTDKNGKKIFEGDIVLTQPIKDRPYSKNAKSKRRLGKVVWIDGTDKHPKAEVVNDPHFDIQFIDNDDDYRCWNWSLFYDCEVIGNIHDNPELLEVAK